MEPCQSYYKKSSRTEKIHQIDANLFHGCFFAHGMISLPSCIPLFYHNAMIRRIWISSNKSTRSSTILLVTVFSGPLRAPCFLASGFDGVSVHIIAQVEHGTRAHFFRSDRDTRSDQAAQVIRLDGSLAL